MVTKKRRPDQCRALRCPSDRDASLAAPLCRPHWRALPKDVRDHVNLCAEGADEVARARAIRKALETLELQDAVREAQ